MSCETTNKHQLDLEDTVVHPDLSGYVLVVLHNPTGEAISLENTMSLGHVSVYEVYGEDPSSLTNPQPPADRWSKPEVPYWLY